MDLVLGVSMTSAAVRWVLVEGITGEGATVDRGAFDLADDVDPDDLLNVILVDGVDERLHAIGVTWTNDAEDAASHMLDALRTRGLGNVIAVSELEAGDVLANGIAEITEYDRLAVCVVEPDAAVVAAVGSDGVNVDRVARPLDGADVVDLPSSVIAMLDVEDRQPEAIFVVGSADDRDLVISTLESVTETPVISATEADIALARGAALASARAVNGLAAGRPRLPTRLGALTSVLVAAVVTFVATLSAAIALGVTSGSDTQTRQAASRIDEPAQEEPTDAPTATAAPRPKKPAPVTEPREAKLVVAQTIAVVAPPAPEAPAYEPPAYIPPQPEAPAPAPAPEVAAPAPVYSPPPPPAYVPPAQTPNYVPPAPRKPRLRDRIIERIPIINRFHEPEYPYPR